jgi:probable O-glycosylation ligase (exosortase A-associated)
LSAASLEREVPERISLKGLLFTYGLTYGGAAASLFNPFVGLCIYICFAIVKPESMWFWSVPEGNYSRTIAVGLLAGWVLKGFGTWDFGRATGVVYALLAFWVWAVLGIAASIDADRSLRCMETMSKIFLPFLVGITTITTLKQVKQLAWVIVLSEGYVALEFNLAYWSGANRLWEAGFGGMDNNCNAIALVTCVGMAFFLALQSEKMWQKAMAFGSMILMMNAIFFSYSRGGMLSLFLTMAFAVVLIPKQPKHYVFFLLVAAIVWRLAGTEVMGRFETAFAPSEQRDYSVESRLDLWSACWDSMLKTPLGLGADNFPVIVEKYGYKPGKEAHTLWLTIGAEFGWPGLVCFVLFFFFILRRLWPFVREDSDVPDPWFRSFARMVIAALVGFCISAQFVSVKYLEHPYYVVLIGAALLKLSTASSEDEWTPEYGNAVPDMPA